MDGYTSRVVIVTLKLIKSLQKRKVIIIYDENYITQEELAKDFDVFDSKILEMKI